MELKAHKFAVSGEQALEEICSQIDSHKGAIFSSGLDYPGRHSRWDIGFINPALEFIASKRTFELNALNPQGEALLSILAPSFNGVDYLDDFSSSDKKITGTTKLPPKYFSEEERSKQSSIFSVIREIISTFKTEDPSFSHFGLYGAFGYDLVHQFEDIELRMERAQGVKDCHLFLPLELVVIDRQKDKAEKIIYEICQGESSTIDLSGGGQEFELPNPSGSTEVVSDHAPGEFAKKVEKVIEGTRRGDYFEVVLSQSFETRASQSPSQLFNILAEVNPSPYLFLINFGDEQLVGSSPEIYVRVSGRDYETCPIAGTVRRGDSPLEDADKVRQLISSKKDESELTMCTDVDRNDMARVCKPGSVKVIGRRQLEFYSHLIHTVDHVRGELADGFDSLDAFQSHMWACTVTGAPKPAALQEIENLESSPRAWFSGAVGLLLFNGDINTGITLRTANLKDGRASIRSGATLLYGSDPIEEEKETRTKAEALISVISTSAKSKSEKEASIGEIPSLELNVLLVDCRDSFVHNLGAYIRELGCKVTTVRPKFAREIVEKTKPQLVFFSPGPGTPEDFQLPELIKELAEKDYPIFGVCLGHQGIAQAFGAKIETLPLPKHGKTSIVQHSGDQMFAGIDSEFEVGRYHSLYVGEDSLPEDFQITARTIASDKEPSVIMGLRHKNLPLASVQFHPESLMTLKGRAGHKILANSLKMLT